MRPPPSSAPRWPPPRQARPLPGDLEPWSLLLLLLTHEYPHRPISLIMSDLSRACNPVTAGPVVRGECWRSEAMPGGAERVALGVREHLGGPDREHVGPAAAVRAAEEAVAYGELPSPVPPGPERRRHLLQGGVVGDPHGLALDHHVHPLIPVGAPGGQHHVGVGLHVDMLLLVRPGGEPHRVVVPDADDRRHVRPPVLPHRADPVQLGALQQLAGLFPAHGGRRRIAVLLVELADRCRHEHLPDRRRLILRYLRPPSPPQTNRRTRCRAVTPPQPRPST